MQIPDVVMGRHQFGTLRTGLPKMRVVTAENPDVLA